MDPTNIFQRVWPRTGAFSERFPSFFAKTIIYLWLTRWKNYRVWNYNQASRDESVELALPRLANFRCHLLRRGIDSAPLFSFAPNQPGLAFLLFHVHMLIIFCLQEVVVLSKYYYTGRCQALFDFQIVRKKEEEKKQKLFDKDFLMIIALSFFHLNFQGQLQVFNSHLNFGAEQLVDWFF
jgi:hypothetical protein